MGHSADIAKARAWVKRLKKETCTCTQDIRTGEVGSICSKCGEK